MSHWATPDLDAALEAAFVRAPSVGKWAWIHRVVAPPDGVSVDALKQRYYTLQRQRGEPGTRSKAALALDTPPTPDEVAHQHAAPAPLSEAEMVALFRVDLTRWQVTALEHRTYHAGAKGPDGEIVTAPLYITRIRCRPLAGADALVALAEGLVADIRSAGAARPRLKPKPVRGADHLLELAPMDLHLGKLSWPAETGAVYDLDHAEAAFTEAFEDLLGQTAGLAVEQVLIPIGNDLLHIDNLEATTTSGTRMDADSRYHKVFRAARALMAWAAQRAVQVAPVRLLVVPGNHDRLGAFHVGEVLAAEFAEHRFITVDNAPTLRKYHRYGQTLLGFTHGSEEKLEALPLLMSNERKQDWAETTCREWHIGHFHKKKELRFTAGDSFHDVLVRVLPSLSAADQWHYQKGYVGTRRAMEAYWYHREDGFRGYAQSRLVQVGAA